MKYSSIQVSPRLQPYIKSIWMLESSTEEAHHKFRFSPDGYIELCFHMKQIWSYSINGEKEKFNVKTKMVGQYSRSLDVVLPASVKIIYIKLYPWVFYTVFGIPLHIFTNNHIQFNDVFKDDAAYLNEQFACITSLEQVRMIVEPWFIKKLQNIRSSDKEGIKMVQFIIDNNGIGKSELLLSQYSRSQRRLQQQFKELVGLSPKQFAKVKRIHRATELIHNTDSLTKTAYQLGYYDQAHFIHDFKYFTGLTPKQFRQSIGTDGKFNNFSI